MELSYKIGLWIFAVTILVSRCQKVPVEPFSDTVLSAEDECSATNDSNAKLCVELGTKIILSPDNGQLSPKDTIALWEDSLLIESVEEDTMRYRLYDLNKGIFTELGKTPKMQLGSGDFVVTEEDVCYFSYSYEGRDDFSMVEIDLSECRIQIKQRYKWFPPFQYYEVVDRDTLLIFGPKKISDSEERYSYHISRYSINSGTEESLVEKPDSYKSGISCFDYDDGYIYAVEFATDNDGRILQCYSLTGEKREAYDLSFMAKYMEKEDAILKVEVVEDYVMLWTMYSQKFVMLRKEKDRLVEVGEWNGSNMRYEEPIKRTNGFGILYDRYKQRLIRYNSEQKCFIEQDIEFPENGKWSGCFMNEEGMVILFATFGETKETQTERYYIVPAV